MSRYIDADKLRSLFDNNSKVSGVFYCAEWEGIDKPSDFQDLIDAQPTADVVEVVRCKDCEHFEAINNDDHGWCKMISDLPCGISARYDDDYCSFGERADT